MKNYFKFIFKNYNYITNYNNYYSIIINLFLLFLLFVKNDYQLIIIYSFIVAIIYFIFYHYFVITLFIIPIIYLLNSQKNFVEGAGEEDSGYISRASQGTASQIGAFQGTTSAAEKEADRAEQDVKKQSKKREASDCEKAFMLSTKTDVDTDKVRSEAEFDNSAGEQSDKELGEVKKALSDVTKYDTHTIGGTDNTDSSFFAQ